MNKQERQKKIQLLQEIREGKTSIRDLYPQPAALTPESEKHLLEHLIYTYRRWKGIINDKTDLSRDSKNWLDVVLIEMFDECDTWLSENPDSTDEEYFEIKCAMME